jgi:hypothetical protein
MKDGLISTREEGRPDVERWVRIERVPGQVCMLQFYDLALPRTDQRFFEVEFDLQLLTMAIAGATSQIVAGDFTCAIRNLGDEMEIVFQPEGWPFAGRWCVERDEFLDAIASVL